MCSKFRCFLGENMLIYSGAIVFKNNSYAFQELADEGSSIESGSLFDVIY